MYYIDLQPFEDFMKERNLVPEKYRSFYVRWVRRFLLSEFNAQELAEKDQITCYLDQLSRDGSVQDWQVNQAEQAVKSVEIYKHVTIHTLRHSFATHLLLQGVNIREVQELLRHKHVETTMIYTHVMRDLGDKPTSPLDML